ncbi:PAS domain S-box protein [Thermopolyspora sp. NPDC052614]|uniref:PAS domain-containing sensor histidine kinase n=1 Tax=Thermopolyspora sp. NPDC052614 TaxID=3155682 RepID=UPI003419CFAE
MKRADHPELAEVLEALARRESELDADRRTIAALNAELEETNRGLIALHAELEEARQAEARLAAIVQSSDDAIFALSPHGVIQTWNPAAERLFGHRERDVVGRPVDVLVPEESHGMFGGALELVRDGDRAGHYDGRLVRADGSLVDVAVTVSAMRDVDGALTGFSAVARDITERLRMEAELAAARADREVMADRERIARDLHDMVIQRVFAAGLALQATAGMAKNPRVTARLHDVVGELDATIRELRTAIFDLHTAPQETVSLRAQILKLTADAAENLGYAPNVSFDGPIDSTVSEEIGVHLLAVVREALSNIAKHAQATAAAVTLSTGDEVVLEVLDNGRGVGATTRSSGLGNMRERAKSLGGTFEIADRPDGGTRLEWRVPLT